MADTKPDSQNKQESVREKIWADKHDAIQDALYNLDEDLADLIVNVAYENVFARPDLDLKTRELLAITCLMSVGTESEIKTHVFGALNNGATKAEIKETILQAAMYLGFPKAVSAMKVLKSIK